MESINASGFLRSGRTCGLLLRCRIISGTGMCTRFCVQRQHFSVSFFSEVIYSVNRLLYIAIQARVGLLNRSLCFCEYIPYQYRGDKSQVDRPYAMLQQDKLQPHSKMGIWNPDIKCIRSYLENAMFMFSYQIKYILK